MKKEFVDLAKYRLEKSLNTLNDAKMYSVSATHESTLNRIYYALFYAVNALLITRGLSSSKHSGVKGLFNREFVNKGLIDISLGRFYFDMFDKRIEGDYRDFVEISEENIDKWLAQADTFIEKVEELILEIIEKEKEK